MKCWARRGGVIKPFPQGGCRFEVVAIVGEEPVPSCLRSSLVRERRWTVEQLQECLRRARKNVPGRAQLRELLAVRAEEPNTDSVLEIRVFRALAPLMPFEVHFSTVLGGRVYVIDAAWPEDRVGAEVVGRAHRVASRSAFDRERRKLNELGAFGWKIAHLTAVMSAEEMIVAVSSLIGRSPSASGPSLFEKRIKLAPGGLRK